MDEEMEEYLKRAGLRHRQELRREFLNEIEKRQRAASRKRFLKITYAFAALSLVAVLAFAITLWRLPIDSETALDARLGQYALSQWNDPLADRAALGLLAIQTDLEGEDYETLQ